MAFNQHLFNMFLTNPQLTLKASHAALWKHIYSKDGIITVLLNLTFWDRQVNVLLEKTLNEGSLSESLTFITLNSNKDSEWELISFI